MIDILRYFLAQYGREADMIVTAAGGVFFAILMFIGIRSEDIDKGRWYIHKAIIVLIAALSLSGVMMLATRSAKTQTAQINTIAANIQ